MANVYLQVDYSTGNIFEYSKTIKEGYESHINTKGTESWRKIYKKGLYAKLEGVSIRETNFGKEISLTTKLGNGDTAYLSLPLLDQKKNIANYAESFIAVLPSLKLGEAYRFFPYNIKGENDKYAKIGVSVKLADLSNESVIETAEKLAKLTYTYTKDGVEVKGDIPAVVWEQDFDGSTSMNSKAKSKFLYEVLTKYSTTTSQPAANQPSQDGRQATPQVTSSPVQVPVGSQPKVEEHDDLPF